MLHTGRVAGEDPRHGVWTRVPARKGASHVSESQRSSSRPVHGPDRRCATGHRGANPQVPNRRIVGSVHRLVCRRCTAGTRPSASNNPANGGFCTRVRRPRPWSWVGSQRSVWGCRSRIRAEWLGFKLKRMPRPSGLGILPVPLRMVLPVEDR